MIEGMFKTELDKVYSLEELLRKTRKLFEDDRKIVEQINSFEQLVNEKRSAVMTTYSNRIEFWKKLIGKYICIKSGTDERKLYAFPYKYITVIIALPCCKWNVIQTTSLVLMMK